MRIGALVVRARGPDQAGRTTGEELSKKLDASGYDVIAVGIGEGELPWLDEIGRFAVVRALTPSTVGVALEEAGAKALQARDRYYLVSYCSPSRAGKRWARIDVNFTTAGGAQRTGSVEHEFDATGFTAGCNAKAPPSFAVAQAEIDKQPRPRRQARRARKRPKQRRRRHDSGRRRRPHRLPAKATGRDRAAPRKIRLINPSVRAVESSSSTNRRGRRGPRDPGDQLVGEEGEGWVNARGGRAPRSSSAGRWTGTVWSVGWSSSFR